MIFNWPPFTPQVFFMLGVQCNFICYSCAKGRVHSFTMILMNKNNSQQRLVEKLATGSKIIFTCRMLDLSTYGSASTANSIVLIVPKRLFLSPERT